MKRMLAAVVLVSLGACGGDGGAGGASASDDSSGPVTITLRALDFGFGLDEKSYPAGSIDLVMINEGAQAHQALLYRLNDGVDVDEFKDTVMKDQSTVPDLAEGGREGISQAAGPGDEASAGSYEVRTGTYALICWLPDQSLKTNKNHAELGMIEAFVVK